MDARMSESPRHKSARLPDFDYSSASTYFFTICTAHRQPFFGEIEAGETYLTRTGMQAWVEWDMTLDLRPTVIEQAFVVMPNHVHGLVSFDASVIGDQPVESHSNATPFHRKSRSLSTLISGYKGAVTRWVRNELAIQNSIYGNPVITNTSFATTNLSRPSRDTSLITLRSGRRIRRIQRIGPLYDGKPVALLCDSTALLRRLRWLRGGRWGVGRRRARFAG